MVTEPATRGPFPFLSEHDAFEVSFRDGVREGLKMMRKQFMVPENVMRFHHGLAYRAHHSYKPDSISVMETQSAGMSVPLSRIVAGDLTLLPEKMHEMTNAMHKVFMQFLYSTLSSTAEETGQTVSGKVETNFEEMFLEMLRKIEFGVDKDGNVSMPQIHAGAEMYSKMTEAVKNSGPEFKQKVEALKKEKIEKALQRERERRSRFKRYE